MAGDNHIDKYYTYEQQPSEIIVENRVSIVRSPTNVSRVI
jgi:hypothetical protein